MNQTSLFLFILPLLIATTLNGCTDGRNGQTFQEIPHILLDFHLFTSSCHHALGQKAPQGPLLGSDILTIPHLHLFSTALPPNQSQLSHLLLSRSLAHLLTSPHKRGSSTAAIQLLNPLTKI